VPGCPATVRASSGTASPEVIVRPSAVGVRGLRVLGARSGPVPSAGLGIESGDGAPVLRETRRWTASKGVTFVPWLECGRMNELEEQSADAIVRRGTEVLGA
jgi:hypothetical protein